MKKITIISAVIMTFCTVFAEVTDFDRQFKEKPEMGIENAVILSEKGVVDHAYTMQLSKYKYERKTKFFTRKGIEDYGTVKLKFDPDEENIGDIEGCVYLPDGKEIKLKKEDIHEKYVSKERDFKGKEISIVFPGLVENAIVEFSYYRSYTSVPWVSHWYFQNELYTVFSEVKFIAWPLNKWGVTMVNQLGEVSQQHGNRGEEKYIILSRKNIPPLKDEAFSFPDSSLRETLFMFYYDNKHKEHKFWQERGRKYYSSELKKWYKPQRKLRYLAVNNSLKGDSNEETIRNIYNYVVSNFDSLKTLPKNKREKIDKKYWKQLKETHSSVDLLEFDTLPGYYLNYLTGSMIKSVIPEAEIYHVKYTPWYKRLFNPRIFTINQFKNTMLKIIVDGKSFWMSPELKFYPMGTVDWGAKGIQLYVMNNDECGFESLSMDDYIQNYSERNVDVFFEEDHVRVKERYILNPHLSFNYRKRMHYYNNNEIEDLVEKDKIEQYGKDAELIYYNIENLDNLDKALILNTEVKFPYFFEEAGDNIFMSLVSLSAYRENHFNSDVRKHNIVFNYPYKYSGDVTYHLPEGLIFDSIPSDVSINKNTLLYKMVFKKINDHTLNVLTERNLEGSMFLPVANSFFKRTYDDIMNATSQKVKLKEVL